MAAPSPALPTGLDCQEHYPHQVPLQNRNARVTSFGAEADVGAVIEAPYEGAFDRLRRGRDPYYLRNRKDGSDVDDVVRGAKALSGMWQADGVRAGRR